MSKFKSCHTFFFSLLTAFTLLFSPGIYASGRDLQLGSVSADTPPEMGTRLTPLAKYLSNKIGISVNFHASPNLESAVEDLGTNNTQIAYLTPAAYLEAHDKYAVIPLVNQLNKGKATFTLMIAVPKNSPVQTVSDLHGKKFAFGDKKAVLQTAVVESTGVKLQDFSSYDYLNDDDNVAKAVLKGDFDAGMLKDTVAAKLEAQGLRVIYTSVAMPSYLFAANKNLPPITVGRIKNAMLALNNNTKENKAILTSIEQGCDGFIVAKDKDFDEIRKLLAPPKDTK